MKRRELLRALLAAPLLAPAIQRLLAASSTSLGAWFLEHGLGGDNWSRVTRWIPSAWTILRYRPEEASRLGFVGTFIDRRHVVVGWLDMHGQVWRQTWVDRGQTSWKLVERLTRPEVHVKFLSPGRGIETAQGIHGTPLLHP